MHDYRDKKNIYTIVKSNFVPFFLSLNWEIIFMYYFKNKNHCLLVFETLNFMKNKQEDDIEQVLKTWHEQVAQSS